MSLIVLIPVTVAGLLVLSSCVTYQPPGDYLWLLVR